MKKVLLLSIAAAISFGTMAQHNDDHNNGKNKKGKHEKKHEKSHDNDRNGEWRQENDRRDANNNNGQWQNQDNQRSNNGYDNRNSGNLPRRVRDAFNRDYPNAKSVNWTNDRGIWSAKFRRSGLFGGNSTVSYRANGQKVNNYIGRNQGITSTNGYYTRNN